VRACTYRFELRDNFYHVSEEVKQIEISDVVADWRCYHKFKEIPPLFQNTPSHEVKDFKDLKNFHSGLDKVFTSAVQFMGELIESMPIYTSFEENFEIVGRCLNEIEKKIEDIRRSSKSGQGLLKQYQTQVAKINAEIKILQADNLICFNDDKPFSISKFVWKEAAPQIEILDDGKTARKNSNCNYAVVAANVGWKSGIHVWYIKAKNVGCYDTIGICDETYFYQVKPLLVGFGPYPGSHRTEDSKGIKFSGVPHDTQMESGSVVKCTLDLSSSFEFSYQIEQEEIFSVQLVDFFQRGTKLYPALNLCHYSSYTLVDPPK